MNKRTGSYYTPANLSQFMLEYLLPHFKNETELSILEPSLGDGSFAKALNGINLPKKINKATFIGIEKQKKVLDKTKNDFKNTNPIVNFKFECNDFLLFHKSCVKKFDMIIGNPPYIKKSFLTKTQRKLSNDLQRASGLTDFAIKNIWSAFVTGSTELLSEKGILGFVLPSELLQMDYTKSLLDFLCNRFRRLEIFTFDELLFECKGQNTVLLLAYKQHESHGQFYANISDIRQLEARDFHLSSNKGLQEANIKWTHHLLPVDDLQFLDNIRKRLQHIGHYCETKPGVVTAANEFFVINETSRKELGLQNYIQPILAKGMYVNGGVIFSKSDFKELKADNKPVHLLAIPENRINRLSQKLTEYIETGVEKKYDVRYKCKLRDHWFVVPNVSDSPAAFFLKRCHHYPKILRNDAHVLVTDTAYKIKMKKNFTVNDLIYSFYNSITLCFTELTGRFYGGGVLELTPEEFKNLPIPYVHIDKRAFKQFETSFENKSSIEDILLMNDNKIMAETLRLSKSDITRIRNIYSTLCAKRLRKNKSIEERSTIPAN